MSTALGTDFLCTFRTTEVDWYIGQGQLEKFRMKPKLWLRGGGGELSEGIAVAEREG